ncbi:hypothetical protein L3i22_060590 [Actinoplanes sp. L3-i22]|nr:hypothetical protein L3i22_060590 [Actinoplanes sp. L3-i22]
MTATPAQRSAGQVGADDHITVTAPDLDGRVRTRTGYVAARTDTTLTLSGYPGGHGPTTTLTVTTQTPVMPAPAVPIDVRLWRGTVTGDPVPEPSPAAIADGDVLRDRVQEHQVQERISELAAAAADPATGPRLALLSPLAQAQLRVAVDDHGPGIIDNPMFRPSPGAEIDYAPVGRYITEGHLQDLAARYGFGLVWEAVEEYARAAHDRDQILTRTIEQVTAHADRRAQQCAELATAAGTALHAGDVATAYDLLDQGQLTDPHYRHRRQQNTWDGLRAIVARRELSGTPAETPAGTPQHPGISDTDSRAAEPEDDLPAPPPAATTGALAGFTPLEQARIRVKVEDRAGEYAASPLIGRNPTAVGRYIGEGGSLHDMAPGERWKAVAAAAREILAVRPELMDLDTPAKRQAFAADRTAGVQQVLAATDAAFTAGDYQRALDLIDRGELLDPNHRPFGTDTWPALREFVADKQREAASPHTPDTDETPAAAIPEPAPTAAVLEHPDLARRQAIRDIAVNPGPALEEKLAKIGDPRFSQNVVEDSARRYALGYPPVRQGRGEYSWLCPVTGCERSPGDLLTLDAVRSMWLAHAAANHPDFVPGWDVDTWPLPARDNNPAGMPRLDDPGFGLHTAPLTSAHAFRLDTGRPASPGNQITLTTAHLAALEHIGDVHGMVYAVIADRRTRQASTVGPFITADAAWSWWHVSTNRAVRHHDRTVLFILIAAADRETRPDHLRAEALEILAAAGPDTSRDLLVWAAGATTALHAAAITHSWEHSGFQAGPNGGGTLDPQAGGPQRRFRHDRRGYHLIEDDNTPPVFSATWRELAAQVRADQLSSEQIRQVNVAAARWNDAAGSNLDPTHAAEAEATAAEAWAAIRPTHTGGRQQSRPAAAATQLPAGPEAATTGLNPETDTTTPLIGPANDAFETAVRILHSPAPEDAARLDSLPPGDVLDGTYLQVGGQLSDGSSRTLTGYLIATRSVFDGWGGWVPGGHLLLTVAGHPDALDGVDIAVPPGTDVTVMEAPDEMPRGTAPWRRPLRHDLVVAALAQLGQQLEPAGRGSPGWRLPGVDEPYVGPDADKMMLAHLAASWGANTDPPVLRQEFVDQALAEGRWAGPAAGSRPLRQVPRGAFGRITGLVDGQKQTIEGTLDFWRRRTRRGHQSDLVDVHLRIPDDLPSPRPDGRRVVTVAVPAGGATFTVIHRPNPAAQTLAEQQPSLFTLAASTSPPVEPDEPHSTAPSLYDTTLHQLQDPRGDTAPVMDTITAAEVAAGAYARLHGLMADGRTGTVTGYVIETGENEGYEGWVPAQHHLMTVAAHPDALGGVNIAVPNEATVSILKPAAGMPPAAQPWRRPGTAHEQVVAHLAEIGMQVQDTVDHLGRPAWTIPGFRRVFFGEHAAEDMLTQLLSAGQNHRRRPLIQQRFIDEAIADGRPVPPEPSGPVPLHRIRQDAYGAITGLVDGVEQTVHGRLDRWWSRSHRTALVDTVTVMLWVPDPHAPHGVGSGERVLEVQVPVTGATFTVTGRPTSSPDQGAVPTGAPKLAGPSAVAHTHYVVFSRLGGGSKYGRNFEQAMDFARRIESALPISPVIAIATPNPSLEFEGWVVEVAHPRTDADTLLALRQQIHQTAESEFGGAYDWEDGVNLPDPQVDPIAEVSAALQRRENTGDVSRPPSAMRPESADGPGLLPAAAQHPAGPAAAATPYNPPNDTPSAPSGELQQPSVDVMYGLPADPRPDHIAGVPTRVDHLSAHVVIGSEIPGAPGLFLYSQPTLLADRPANEAGDRQYLVQGARDGERPLEQHILWGSQLVTVIPNGATGWQPAHFRTWKHSKNKVFTADHPQGLRVNRVTGAGLEVTIDKKPATIAYADVTACEEWGNRATTPIEQHKFRAREEIVDVYAWDGGEHPFRPTFAGSLRCHDCCGGIRSQLHTGDLRADFQQFEQLRLALLKPGQTNAELTRAADDLDRYVRGIPMSDPSLPTGPGRDAHPADPTTSDPVNPSDDTPAPAPAAEPLPATPAAGSVEQPATTGTLSAPSNEPQQLSIDFLFGMPSDHPPADAPAPQQLGDQHEPVRPTDDGALAGQPQRRVPGAAGPTGTLHPAGRGDRADGRGRNPSESRADAGSGELPAAAPPAEDGPQRGGERDNTPLPAGLAAAAGHTGPQPSDRAPFRPTGQLDLAPSGEIARIRANMAVVRLLTSGEPTTTQHQPTLAAWSGWGAVPALFDERAKFAGRFAAERAELRELLGEDGYRSARGTTLNAHYTDAALVETIWETVGRLGFTGGTVLEPGCGSGNFIGFAPAGIHLTGVEVDPTTAAVAQALYPHAYIRAESFADTRIDPASMDLAIGNVPFGQHHLHDPAHNPGRKQPIHNHFSLKAAAAVRPGGLIALITSSYTLDGASRSHQVAREQLAAQADLIAAYRLPTGAHQKAAGTDTVTDLLILRRHDRGTASPDADWLTTTTVSVPHAEKPGQLEQFPINQYFLSHLDDAVLGRMTASSGRNRPMLTVDPGHRTAADLLRAATARLATSHTSPAVAAAPVMLTVPDPDPEDGMFFDEGNATFTQISNGERNQVHPPASQVVELQALIKLRNTVVALLNEEAAHREDTARMSALRQLLQQQYQQYAAAHEPINRCKVHTATRTDKDGNRVEQRRHRYPQMGGFRDDPYFPYLQALEVFDDTLGEVTGLAEVFYQRVIAVPDPVDRVGNPADAVAVCWDRHNTIRLDVIASLLGTDTEDQARQLLGETVYDEPGTGQLIRKAEYLSGNVRRKLAAARAAAQDDPQFAVNVRALEAVLPRDRTPAEIGAQLGSPWIPAATVQDFLREILQDGTITVAEVAGKWSVGGGKTASILSTTVWGTEHRSATALAQTRLNQQDIQLTKTIETAAGSRTVNDPEATACAQAKAEQLDSRFRQWLWEDPDRSRTLVTLFNDTFNARIMRTYDGERVEAPGMSTVFELRPHQHAAVIRMRETPGAGLFHGTGAGKTLEMIVGGMELKRLGLVNKPCYIVPKGVLGQFKREFLQAYPRARILAADSEDLTGDQRRKFVARCSTGAWDAIILSHEAFKSIPVSRDVELDYRKRQVARLEKHLEGVTDADRYTVKDVEKQIAKLDEQIKELQDKKSDPATTFERTGIDYLVVDEVQKFRKLPIISAVRELANPEGNQRSVDLEMTLEYLRASGRRRVITLATATPIDNSPSELYSMIRYGAPELLDEMGLHTHDQFVAAFIQPRRRIEMRADGAGFESRSRHVVYVNVNALKRHLLFAWADVKLKEHLDLGEPTIIGGKPEILAVPGSEELGEQMRDIAIRSRDYRARDPQIRYTVSGELREDNPLWMSTDGRKASLAVRLVGRQTSEPEKVDATADRIMQIWGEHRDDVYHRADGTPEPVRGSLILVFCDLGVPSDNWNVYEGLRDELVRRGMPRDLIRFDQDAKNPRQRARLDQDARDGKVAVLLGNREGLGTGRNIQRRAIAVVQLDATWRYTLLEQSLGRAQRQGNANPAIHHIFVVTEGSYDPFLWQKVDHKARFFRQILDPDDTTNVIDLTDVDDNGGKIDPSVMLAVATGKPELLDLARLEEAVATLKLEQRIWHDEQFTLAATIEQNRRTIAGTTAKISTVDALLAARTETRGDAFRMTINGASHTKRVDAGQALATRLLALAASRDRPTDVDVAVLGGISITATELYGQMHLDLQGVWTADRISLTGTELAAIARGEQDAVGTIRKLENRIAGLDGVRDEFVSTIARLEANIANATSRAGLPYPQQEALEQAKRDLERLVQELGVLDPTTPGSAPETGAPSMDEPGAPRAVVALPHRGGLPATAGPSAPTPSPPADPPSVTATDPTVISPATAGTPNSAAEPTPEATYDGPITPPTMWVVTAPGMPGAGPRTTLQVGPDDPEQMLRHQGWQPDSGNPVAFDGHRFTVRFPDGNTFYSARPLLLPWRALQPGDAATLDVGTTGRWHYAEGMPGSGAHWDRHDVRRHLAAAEGAGAPIAVTDWGVIISRHRTQVFIRDDAEIPAVPDVPLPQQKADSASQLTSIVADLPIDQQQWLTRRLTELARDERIQSFARANSHDRVANILHERLDELIADAGNEPSLADAMSLLVRYFDDTEGVFRGPFLEAAGRHLYAQARIEDPFTPARPDQPTTQTLAEPAEPDASDTAEPATARLTHLLNERDLTDQQRLWLMSKIDMLAREPRTVAAARANDYENFHHAVANPIADLASFVAGDELGDDGFDLHSKLTGHDGPQTDEFITTVSAYLYESAADLRVPAPAAPGAEQPAPGDSPMAEPGPSVELAGPEPAAAGLPETQRRRRGHAFYPPADLLSQIPPLYATDGIPKAEKAIYLHYFGGSRDYWIAEYDPATGEAFGYGGTGNALDGLEWGYSYLPELEKLNVGLTIIERDLDWAPVRAGDANLPGDAVDQARQPERREPGQEAAAGQQASVVTSTAVGDQSPARGPDGVEPGAQGDRAGGDATPAAVPAPVRVDQLRGGEHVYVCGIDKYGSLSYSTGQVQAAPSTVSVAGRTATGRVSRSPQKARPGLLVTLTTSEQSQMPIITGLDGFAEPVTDAAHQFQPTASDLPHLVHGHCSCGWKRGPGASTYASERNNWARHVAQQALPPTHVPQVSAGLLEQAEQFGRNAHAQGRPSAPGADIHTLALVTGWPVGAGADQVFAAFSRGYRAAADQAATAAVAGSKAAAEPRNHTAEPGDQLSAAQQPAAEPTPDQDSRGREQLTDRQQRLLYQLRDGRGEPWSVRRQSWIKTFHLTAVTDRYPHPLAPTMADLSVLSAADRATVTAGLQDSLTSPDHHERAMARATLRAWSDARPVWNAAQQQALDALASFETYGVDALEGYGRLTVQEYLGLDPDDRADLSADLRAIVASRATKTIPSNRTSYGTTIRGVEADHVSGARSLLGIIGRGVQPRRFHEHADKVGRTVLAGSLNPGDQIMVRNAVMTVDRIGIDGKIRLVGGKGATLSSLTSRYKLLAAASAPTDPDPGPDRAAGAQVEPVPRVAAPPPAAPAVPPQPAEPVGGPPGQHAAGVAARPAPAMDRPKTSPDPTADAADEQPSLFPDAADTPQPAVEPQPTPDTRPTTAPTEPAQAHQQFISAGDGLDDVRAVLARSRILDTRVILPTQPLPRTVWQAVHTTFTVMGATGGRRIGQPYRFPTDRSADLAAFLAGGPAPQHERTTAGWVRTPDLLAADVVARFAELDGRARPLRVLEPSAGDGSLIRAVLAAAPDADVTAVEPSLDRATAIAADHGDQVRLHNTTIEDYAALWRQRNDQPFELIVMNPPYSVPGNRTIWADHVRIAWLMLAEGGRLVAILPGRPDQRSDPFSTDLMALLGPDLLAESLPAKSFDVSGADVDTSVLAVTRPVTNVDQARARYAASLYRLADGEPLPVDTPKLSARDAAETPVQTYRDFSGPRVARYVGTCVLCSTPTWSDGSNDPRGMLGANAVQTLRAAELDLEGPDVCRCWTCASTSDTYNRSVVRATTMWTTPEPAAEPAPVDGIRVWTFASTAAAYDAINMATTPDDIFFGDVVHVPDEQVVGLVDQAWGAAVTVAHGEFHEADLFAMTELEYEDTVRAARRLARDHGYPLAPLTLDLGVSADKLGPYTAEISGCVCPLCTAYAQADLDQAEPAGLALLEACFDGSHTRTVPDPSCPGAAPAGSAALADTTPVPPELRTQDLKGLDDGEPYTSTKRIRGPLRDVKIASNALLRTRGAASKVGPPLVATIEVVKQINLDATDPTDLLLWSVALAQQSRAALRKLNPAADGGLVNMLSSVVRAADTLAGDLVATARKPNRWQRLFDQPAPDLHSAAAIVRSPARSAAAAAPQHTPAAAELEQSEPVRPGLAAAPEVLEPAQGDLFTMAPQTLPTPTLGAIEPGDQPTPADPPVGETSSRAHPQPDQPAPDRATAEPIAAAPADGRSDPDSRSDMVPSAAAEPAHLPDLVPAAAGDPDPSTEATTMPDTATTGARALDHILVTTDGSFAQVSGTTGSPAEGPLRDFLKNPANFQGGLRFYLWADRGMWVLRGTSTQARLAAEKVSDWLKAEAVAPATGPAAARTAAPRTVTKPGKRFTPTAQQQAIIDAYRAEQNIAVLALAGTGKTSTLVLLAEIFPDKKIAYFAFNRSVADEAKGKFGTNVYAATSHSFAMTGLRNHPIAPKLRRVLLNEGWPQEWAEKLGIEEVLIRHKDRPSELVMPERVAAAVMGTLTAFRHSADPEISARHLPDNVAQGSRELREMVLRHTEQAWADKNNLAGTLPFNPDDYRKIWALTNPKLPYDVIFYDEGQDLNPVMEKVVQDHQAAGTQVVVVGDSNQAIYGFLGARDAIIRWPADVTLPLTQSHRFGSATADLGNRLLTSLNSRWKLQGTPALNSKIGPIPYPDAVLARTNAGAVAAVFEAFDQNRRVALVGGSKVIEDIAKAALKLQAGRRTGHPDLQGFEDWTSVVEAVENEENGAQSLRAFVRLVQSRGAQKLLDMARDLVSEEATTEDGKPAYDVIVCTGHKAKGLEWDFVRIASDWPQPETDRETGEVRLPDAEERRLAYVAVTRAQLGLELGSLAWVTDLPLASSARAVEAQKHNTTPQQDAAETAAEQPTAQAGAATEQGKVALTESASTVAADESPGPDPASTDGRPPAEAEDAADFGAAMPQPAGHVPALADEPVHEDTSVTSEPVTAVPGTGAQDTGAQAGTLATARAADTTADPAAMPRTDRAETAVGVDAAAPAVSAERPATPASAASPEQPARPVPARPTLVPATNGNAPPPPTPSSTAPGAATPAPTPVPAGGHSGAGHAPSAGAEPPSPERSGPGAAPNAKSPDQAAPAVQAPDRRVPATTPTTDPHHGEVAQEPAQTDRFALLPQAHAILADFATETEPRLVWALAAAALRSGTAVGDWWDAPGTVDALTHTTTVDEINDHVQFRVYHAGARLEERSGDGVLVEADWATIAGLLDRDQIPADLAQALTVASRAARDAEHDLATYPANPMGEPMPDDQRTIIARARAARQTAAAALASIWKAILPARPPAPATAPAGPLAQEQPRTAAATAAPATPPTGQPAHDGDPADPQPAPARPATPGPGPQPAEAPPAGGVAPMQPADRSAIKIVVIDTAAEFFGGSQDYGIAGTAVHLAQHQLADETRRFGLIPVVQAAADVMQQDQSILTRPLEQRRALRADRNAQSEMFAALIRSLAGAGDTETALRLIGEAELHNPRHHTTWADETSVGWAEVGDRIRNRTGAAAAAAQAFTPLPARPPAGPDRPAGGPGQAFTGPGGRTAIPEIRRPSPGPAPATGSRPHR